MMRRIFFILLLVSTPWSGVFAENELPVVVQTFEQYQENAKNFCDAPEREWSTTNTLVPIPQYPRLETGAVNRQMARTQSLSTLTSEERYKLQNDLHENHIGDFSGYKTRVHAAFFLEISAEEDLEKLQ